MCIAYFQPITRAELSSFFGKEISRDLIGHLRDAGLIASGPRTPTPGAPYTYVTTKQFLLEFGLERRRARQVWARMPMGGQTGSEGRLIARPLYRSRSGLCGS
jgi:chromosome segregation and condensation protein ScpB